MNGDEAGVSMFCKEERRDKRKTRVKFEILPEGKERVKRGHITAQPRLPSKNLERTSGVIKITYGKNRNKNLNSLQV
jgi:hypothetical protein